LNEVSSVLSIGAGPSGIEITLAIGKAAKSVTWSNHAKKTYGRDLSIKLPENANMKVDVAKFVENGAVFEDGSFEEFSVVVYSTGYDFRFPFLSVDCGLSVDTKHVKPLFKHCININQPTMAIIALPFFAVGVPLYDLQVRFALKFMSGTKNLPSKAEMLQDMQEDEDQRKSEGFPKKKSHFLGLERHSKYYEDLAASAEIQPMKPVIPKIFNKTVANIFADFNSYRQVDFKIVDDENFEESLRSEKS
jgi:dimethylaniline monooxygenase (N-oxide forming)